MRGTSTGSLAHLRHFGAVRDPQTRMNTAFWCWEVQNVVPHNRVVYQGNYLIHMYVRFCRHVVVT